MNNITILGRIGRDAETRYTASGTAVASFSVAVDTGYGDKKKTNWFKCVLFGKRAEGGLIQYLVKGQQVAVSGEISLDEWDDNDGNHRASLSLVVNDLDLVGGQIGSNSQSQPQQQAAPAPAPAAPGTGPINSGGTDDGFNDIPF